MPNEGFAHRWRNLSLLLGAQTISVLGDQSLYVAQIFWGKSLTQTAHFASILLAMNSIPRVLFGPIAGVVADSVSRKKILICCDLLSAACLAICATAIFSDAVPVPMKVLAFAAASLGVATAATFFVPAVSALIPQIVSKEDLGRANSVKQGLRDASGIIGQSVSGILFASLGAVGMMALDAASFVGSGLLCIGINAPSTIQAVQADGVSIYKAFVEKLKAGFQQVWHDHNLRWLTIAIVTINVAFAPFPLLLPFILQRLAVPEATWFGFLMGAFAGGNVLGALTYSKVLAIYAGRPARFKTGLIAMWLPLVLLGWLPHPLLGAAALFAAGIFTGHLNVRIASKTQEIVAVEGLGRVFSVFATVSSLITPLTLLSVGALPSTVDVGYPGLVQSILGATGLVAMVLAGKRFPEFMAAVPTPSR